MTDTKKDEKPVRYKAMKRLYHPINNKFYDAGEEYPMDHRKPAEISHALKQGWIAVITPDEKGS